MYTLSERISHLYHRLSSYTAIADANPNDPEHWRLECRISDLESMIRDLARQLPQEES